MRVADGGLDARRHSPDLGVDRVVKVEVEVVE
jgi:hypothetical protein